MSEGQVPAEYNKFVVRRFWEEVVNKGNLNVVNDVFAPDCVVHDPVFCEIEGRAAVREHVRNFRTLFPDISVSLEAQVDAEDSQVVTRWFATGTHTGKLGELPPFPTGQRVDVWGMSLSRVTDGNIEEAWIVMEFPDPPPGGPPGWADDFCRKFPRLCR
jgi:steroid delta-isomerase-like uncharacterized protein